jgi:hypothetical protein
VAVHQLISALSNGFAMQAAELAMHLDDPRWDQPDPSDVKPRG